MKNFYYLFLIYLFFSCSAEKDYEIPQEKKIFVSEFKINNEILKTNPKLEQALTKVNQIVSSPNNLDVSLRLAYNLDYGLFFNDQKGLFVDNGSQKSYTFPVLSLQKNEKIKNICFNENSNGDYDVYLVKYDMTKQEA